MYASDETSYQILDALALETGADKSSNYHNYTQVYAPYFSSLRDKPIKFLEIGIYKGASVQLWERYFKNADLHFIDISLALVEYSSPRSHYHVVDQESARDLEQFIQATGGEFDVIIDDGGHTMRQQITSFCTLFPHFKSGGMYIVEDLHTSYWSGWGQELSSVTMVDFLKGLVDDINAVGARSGRASHLAVDPSLRSELTPYQESILSIHFYDSVAVIIKR
jgi:hypothetical protein